MRKCRGPEMDPTPVQWPCGKKPLGWFLKTHLNSSLREAKAKDRCLKRTSRCLGLFQRLDLCCFSWRTSATCSKSELGLFHSPCPKLARSHAIFIVTREFRALDLWLTNADVGGRARNSPDAVYLEGPRSDGQHGCKR